MRGRGAVKNSPVSCGEYAGAIATDFWNRCLTRSESHIWRHSLHRQPQVNGWKGCTTLRRVSFMMGTGGRVLYEVGEWAPNWAERSLRDLRANGLSDDRAVVEFVDRYRESEMGRRWVGEIDGLSERAEAARGVIEKWDPDLADEAAAWLRGIELSPADRLDIEDALRERATNTTEGDPFGE